MAFAYLDVSNACVWGQDLRLATGGREHPVPPDLAQLFQSAGHFALELRVVPLVDRVHFVHV